MEIKEINKIIQSEDKDEKSKSVKCICINYGDFLADCEGFVQKRYHDFKCNPKHQFEKKADTILENAIHEKNFMPDLFLIRLNRKQSACNSQIDFVFELLDKSFLETDPIRKSEISEENLINGNLDFNITSEALNLTAKLDIDSHNNNNNGIIYNWIELLAYLACKNGGDFKSFKKSDLDTLVNKLSNVETISDLTNNLKFYDYYYESYSAVLSNFIGNYEIETENEDGTKSFKSRYGLKAFLPIAKNYSFSHYDDFGNSRSYGFKRTHLGNDLMGSIGIPIIAVESGIVENLGWNQYGGWRIGIRSFDTKRYYYYAHLRKNHPYVEGLEEGKTVNAGDVIGYLGMTGYSTKENVNNINVPHLHFGMQLIFDESQVDSPNEIWIDVYQIIEFLKNSRSEVYMNNKETKDYVRKYAFNENTSF